MKKLKQIGLLFLPFMLLAVFVLFTNPYDIALPFLIVPFVLIGVGLFRFLMFALLRGTKLSMTRVRLVAGLATSLILLLALLQSIGQLSLKDFLLLLALLCGLTFYLRRV